jgi:hypothetical protein
MTITEHVVTIVRKEGTWTIDHPALNVKRGDAIIWKLDPNGEHPENAYFQFPPGLVEKTQSGGDEAEYELLAAKGQREIVLHVLDNDVIWRTGPHHYAIFIENGFVKGTNPPPKIDVGK